MRNTLRAFFLVVPSIGLTDALPQKFPDSATERDKILHCVAVEHSVTLASLVGAELVNQSGGKNGTYYGETVKVEMLADWFTESLGGEEVVAEARNRALSWEENWRSNGQTFWAPMMSGTGTPYNVREGALLASHQISCRDFFSLLAGKNHRDLYSSDTRTVDLLSTVAN